jgi:hypothetical protein
VITSLTSGSFVSMIPVSFPNEQRADVSVVQWNGEGFMPRRVGSSSHSINLLCS